MVCGGSPPLWMPRASWRLAAAIQSGSYAFAVARRATTRLIREWLGMTT